jgi:hypothetical protein
MSDGVLAAVIAAGATVFTSFLQLRTSLAKEFAARGVAATSRRKSKFPLVLILAMLVGALIGGFALAQWLHDGERIAQSALERDLRERIADLTKTQGELQQARNATHAEIEAEILGRMGTEGVTVLATVAPCKPADASTRAPTTTPTAQPVAVSTAAPAASASVATTPCTESDAAQVTLCATVPIAAKLTGVELFVRAPDTATPWTESRAMPGQEIQQARFAEKSSEVTDATTRHVCQAFQHWAGQPRVARMVVHYGL